MKTMKKTFFGIVLSCLMAVCLCLGITFIKARPVTASASATFTETSISVRRYDDANKRLMLNVEGSDLLAAAANTYYVADAVSELNTFDYVLVNGKSMRELGVTGFFVNLYTEAAIAFEGVTLSTYDTVTVKEGAQVPSAAYLQGTSNACYIATSDFLWTHDGSNWGVQHLAFTETNTTIVSLTGHTNNHIGFELATSDYETNNQIVTKDALAKMNTLSSITYNGKTLGSSLIASGDTNVYLRLWTNANKIYFPMAAPVAGDVVKIAAGTQFPTNAYASNATQTAYVIPYEIAYKYNGSAWVVDYSNVTFAQTETVANVENYANNRLKIALSVSDYASATNNESVYTNTDKFAAFNTLTKITVNGTPLKDVTASSEAAFLQMWGQPALWVNMPEPTAGTKVSIPAGTQFPSAEFIFNGGTTCYVTTEDCGWTYDGSIWVKDIVFESTNTVASVGDYANNRLKIALSVSDYANAPNNTFTLNEEQFNALNTLTNITVNGTTLAELWNGDIAFMQMWGQPALWVPITAPTAGTVVVIPAGTQFPSYAYMNAGTATCYTTSTAIAYKYDGSAWKVDYSNVDFAEEVTSISDMEWVSDVRLMVSITPNDYGTATENYVNQNVSNEKLSVLNTLDNILVDGNSLRALGITTADLNYWTYWGRFTVALPEEPTKVVFQAGTQIPSMAFVKDNVPSCYVIEEAIAFKYENGMWSETAVEEPKTFDTSIVSVTPHTNNHIGLELSTSDYTGGTLAANDAIASLNILTNITYNGKTLKDSLIKTGDQNIYLDMWGNHHIIYFPMAAPAEGDVISIPAGTQFPSYLGASGGLANTYVTTEDVTYTYMSGTWVEKIEINWVPTAATASVLRIGDQRLMLSISGSDYANAPNNTSFDVNKLAQLNTLDYILLNGVPFSSLGLSEYFVNLYASGAIAFGKISVANGDMITIKAGAQFPSYAFINTGVASCYVTQKEVSYKYHKVSPTGAESGDWSIFEETPTTIQKVVFNDTKEDANNVLYLWPSNHDYGNTEGTVDVSGGIGKLNTYDYIEVDGVKLSNLSIGGIAINFFTRWGALGIKLNDYNLENEPSYIYLKAGCQIPSLSFAKDASVMSVYVVEEDTWIVYNDYHDVWDITMQKPNNHVEAGDILPYNESIANRIFLGWELNGNLYKAGTVAPVAGIANAVYLDYALEDGASIRMADTADESGIRFTAHLQEESYNAYSEYVSSVGVIILPLELLGSEAFTVAHSATAVNFYASKEKGFTFVDGVMTTRATIQTVRATNYNRDYAARAYVYVNYADGSTDYVYGCFQEENHVRNIYEVATEAYKKGEGTDTQRTVLQGYAGKIADITFDGTNFTATTGTIDSALTGIETCIIENGIVRLVLTSDCDSEPLLLINGEPIRGESILEKTYENNLLTLSFVYEMAEGLTFYASDEDMQNFFQDYFELYSMAGAYAVTHSGVSNGPTYQQAWYMNAMAWFKATDLIANNSSANENATYSAEDYAKYYLNNIDIDKNGNVYSQMNDKSHDTPGNGPAYSTVTSYYLMNSQGWPLPHMESKGWEAFHSEFNDNVTDETLKAEMNSQTDFYKNAYEDSSCWSVNGSSVEQFNGVARYMGTAKTGLENATGATNAIVYEETDLSYSSYNAPFVELRLLINDPNGAITDFAIEWRTDDVWYSVTQSEYANNPYEIPNATGSYRSFFPLYTHANYGAGKVVYGNDDSSGKEITGWRVVLIAKDTTSNVTVDLDYVRATADSRHSVNGPNYILALNEYAANHNDLELLKNNITRARKAMLFQLYPLQGLNKGFVDLSYLHRHDSYEGAANNFWDIYPAGNYNADANISFYQALLALAEMEEVLAAKGISVAEMATIEWHDLSGVKQTATYAETANSLRALAATVKTNIQDIFYNTTTGRFAWSVRDVASKGGKAKGSLMDYGFTELNLRAIEAGIATDTQANSIMQWISGARTVNGDKVTGGGIYEQPFAPVTTTVDNQKYTVTALQMGLKESDFTAFYIDKDFGVLCQDGGTIMHVSYYDVLARAKILGVDDAYTRITAIKDWFVAVQDANPNASTVGWADFFKNYDEYSGSGQLQGGESQGKYGLQDEFKEAVMVMATAPKIFLGLEAHYDTLTIAPNLGSNLTSFGMENLSFGEHSYACYVTASSISLSGITRNVNSGLNVTLKLAYDEGKQIYLNGKLLNSNAYTVENGYVIVTTDFANLTLQVK